MPCNLAVSIAKAQVPEEWMKELLSSEIGQELTETFLTAYLEQQYAGQDLRIRKYSNELIISLGDFEIQISNGKVTVRSEYEPKRKVKTLSQEITSLLTQLADKLFQNQLKTTLEQSLGVVVEEQEETVENEGQTLQSTVFTLTL